MHYNPIGKPQTDRTRLGIWFNKATVTHELLIRQAGDPLATTKGGLSLYRAEGKEVEYSADEGSTRRRSKTPDIPPYSEDWSLTGITPSPKTSRCTRCRRTCTCAARASSG
jgi:hypothetical protein